MRVSNTTVVVAALVFLATTGAHAAVEVIDFDSLPTGMIVTEVFGDQGTGPVKVKGINGRFGEAVNAAIIFDSSNPTGDDFDLGSPNEVFGGPGKGIGGREGKYANRERLGKLLIVAENMVDADGDGLIDDPDDEGQLQQRVDFEIDFSAVGPVTVHRMTLIDVEERERTPTVHLIGAAGTSLDRKDLDITDDNGVARIDLGPTEGVLRMLVQLHGSGAISSIRFERGKPRPSIDIEKLTNGAQADLPTDADVPRIAAGQPVTWTYIVTNTGAEQLQNVTVTDDRGVPVSCPKATLDAGETMECTGSGVAVDLVGRELGYQPVPGLCGKRENQPLYANVGSVEAVGTVSELTVTDSDPSHYCNGGREPGIYVRKQKKGRDVRGIPSGTQATFEIFVKNTGDVELTDVTVSDVLSPDCDRTFPRLAPGESKRYECSAPTLTIGGQYVTDCAFVNEVIATGQGGGRTVTDRDTSTLELIGLEIDKTYKGADKSGAHFEITVTNRGCDLDGVVVTDELAPACARQLGALGAGKSESYTCSMPLEFENQACAEGSGASGKVSACDSATFVVVGDKPDQPDTPGIPEKPEKPEKPDQPETPEKPTNKASNWLLLLALALLVGGGLFAWNRMKAG